MLTNLLFDITMTYKQIKPGNQTPLLVTYCGQGFFDDGTTMKWNQMAKEGALNPRPHTCFSLVGFSPVTNVFLTCCCAYCCPSHAVRLCVFITCCCACYCPSHAVRLCVFITCCCAYCCPSHAVRLCFYYLLLCLLLPQPHYETV